MPTLERIADLRRITEDVASVAGGQVLSAWRSTAGADVRSATYELTQMVPAIVGATGDVAATLAADWYEDVRQEAGVRGGYRARLAPSLPDAQLLAMVRWAVGPLWTAEADWDAALRNLLAGSERLTRLSSRSTVTENSWSDPAAGGFVRTTRPDACAFCLMLASRGAGAVYRSEETATIVGASGRIRGTRKAGESFHDDCRCDVSPVFSPDDIPAANRALEAEWREVTKGSRDPLQAWRDHIAATRS